MHQMRNTFQLAGGELKENNGVFKKGMKFIEYTSITICSYVLNWSQAIWMSRKIGPI